MRPRVRERVVWSRRRVEGEKKKKERVETKKTKRREFNACKRFTD